MKILGDKVINRTENWRTVTHFYGLSKEAKESLVKELLANHSGVEPDEVQLEPGDVHVELFWKGMRDYVYKKRDITKDTWVKKFADIYNSRFSDLREFVQIPKYRFPELKDKNYDVSKAEYQSTLYSNLTGTEIDIVLETSDYLFIGEAKDESTLTGRGKYVLVHQLIRQYVMARTLQELVYSSNDKNDKKEVIPFIVGTKLSSIRNHGQVKLMLDKGWLKNENIVSWNRIRTWTGR